MFKMLGRREKGEYIYERLGQRVSNVQVGRTPGGGGMGAKSICEKGRRVCVQRPCKVKENHAMGAGHAQSLKPHNTTNKKREEPVSIQKNMYVCLSAGSNLSFLLHAQKKCLVGRPGRRRTPQKRIASNEGKCVLGINPNVQ